MKRGFTLIELMIVLSIVGILAAIFAPPIMRALGYQVEASTTYGCGE